MMREPSSYFQHKPYCRFASMNKPSMDLQSHESSFEELAKCSKTPGLDLNFQGHLSRRTSEIENLPVLHEMTPVRAITCIYVIIFWLLTCLVGQMSLYIIQPVRGAIFRNFYLSGTVGQSLRSSPEHLPGVHSLTPGRCGHHICIISKTQFVDLVVNYGISNTIVLEIP